MKKRFSATLLFFGLLMGILYMSNGCGYNACVDSECQNNAPCVNGECKCTFGYEGENCQTEKFAASLTIDSVVLVSFPAPIGLAWDPEFDTSDVNSNPDIYLDIWSSKRDTTYLGEASRTEVNKDYDGLATNMLTNIDMNQLPVTIPVGITKTELETLYSFDFIFYDDDTPTATSLGNVEEQLLTSISNFQGGLKVFNVGGLEFSVYFTVVP